MQFASPAQADGRDARAVRTWLAMYRASRESEIGARCILLWNSRFSTTLLKPLSVRRARKEYSCAGDQDAVSSKRRARGVEVRVAAEGEGAGQ